MRFMRMPLVVLTAVVGAIFAISASPALASSSSVKDNCSVCQVVPATATTQTVKSSSSSSSTHIHAVTSFRPKVRQYEKISHVRVTIDKIPGGVKSYAGCVNPISKGWIKDGGYFSNTGGVTQWRFTDKWKAGNVICHPHLVTIAGQKYMQGTKGNCGNPDIRIPLFVMKVTKFVPVKRFVTVRSFVKTYDEWITKQSKSSSTSTTTTTYSCAAGWDKTTENGQVVCKLCPPPCPPPPPPPPPAKAHAFLVKVALKDGASVSLVGGEFSFSVTVNGTSTSSTTNAASGQSRDLGQFNPGDSVQVCETNTGGYTPDQVCISHTMSAGENFTFSFTNRKTTPPPTQSAVLSNLTHLQNPTGVLAGVTYTICEDVSTSTSMTVIFSADTGSVASGSSTVNGTQRVCVSYTAPNDAVIAPDTYHVKVFYNGQLMAQDSWTVQVNPQPAG